MVGLTLERGFGQTGGVRGLSAEELQDSRNLTAIVRVEIFIPDRQNLRAPGGEVIGPLCLFGGKGQRPESGGDGGNNFQPDMKSAGIGVGLIVAVVALIWLGSGFFIVQEGQQAVVMTFGRYSHTVDAGFQWRMPYPFQSHETVSVTTLRSKEVGRNTVVPATGLRDRRRGFGLPVQERPTR